MPEPVTPVQQAVRDALAGWVAITIVMTLGGVIVGHLVYEALEGLQESWIWLPVLAFFLLWAGVLLHVASTQACEPLGVDVGTRLGVMAVLGLVWWFSFYAYYGPVRKGPFTTYVVVVPEEVALRGELTWEKDGDRQRQFRTINVGSKRKIDLSLCEGRLDQYFAGCADEDGYRWRVFPDLTR